MTLVGNPIMHHLVLGLDPTELGGAPFALALDAAYEARARDLGLDVAPGAFVYALPCIAGHVGADAAGVVLAEGPHLKDELTLLVDVGTNAEIVFGNRERLLACSSPTGPAFEGAQISCGQRAAPGAIERVRIDRATLEPKFKVIGCDLWSDELGFAAATANIGVTGVCGSGIIEAIAEMFLAGIVSEDGVIDGELAARTKRIEAVGRTFAYVLHEGAPRLLIYQTDVRAIQLAKAALYAGAKLLMERAGAKPERVTLAGAFGSHIDPLYAMTLGLIPDCDLAKVASAGNAAGTGARIALLNLAARAEIESVVRRIEKIETAIEPAFQRHFVAAMAFPNKEDAFPNLARRITLPRAQGAERERAREGEGAPHRRSRADFMSAVSKIPDLARVTARLDALTDWERRPRSKMRVGLEPMRDLAARLGEPEKSFRSIHVAGTKGKGSVSALIEAALVRAGVRVGRYASPHVERLTERVSLDGREIDEPTLARALDRALDAYEAARKAATPAANATWFDLLTAAAFVIFAETQREWAVVEVGLGGRLDSTNIVDGEIAIVTNIELEHTEILGQDASGDRAREGRRSQAEGRAHHFARPG